MGLDIEKPRLFWNADGKGMQKAYEIEYLLNDTLPVRLPIMKSGSMRTVFTPELKSRDRVCWRIRLTDENRETGEWSEWASFEIGLLNVEDWKAKWIMGDYEHSSKSEIRYPVDCFKKEFTVKSALKRVRLYITACGLYEVKINGHKVGNRVFTPGSTAFQKRVHYQTYDVTEMIQSENTFTIELADGFYSSKTGCFNKAKVFGYEPKIIAQLELVNEKDDIEIVGTDGSFLWSNDSEIRYADMKDGETVDSRMSATYTGTARVTEYQGIICADNNVPVIEKEQLINPRVVHCPDGNTVLDFGQNIAGYVEFTVTGAPGHKVSLICGEKLDDNGNFTIKNILLSGDYDTQRMQREEFICDGSTQTYHPKFSVMGFQYVMLLDWPEKIKPENFRAIAVYSDMRVTGKFQCSDSGICRILQNTMWSVKGNFLDVPTDCPTRERAGWTGDAQLFFNTGNYLMDQAAFFRKWMRDMADCQKNNGMIYNINPSNPGAGAFMEWLSVEGGVGWGDAFLMIPYFYWKRYGDDMLIRLYWDQMVKCFGFYKKRIGKRNLFTLFKPGYGKYSKYLCTCGRDFGEWTEPDDCAPGKTSLLFPHTEEGTAYIAFDAGIMAEMAEHLGYNDAEMYRKLHENVKQAYRHYFLGDGTFSTDRMCKYVRPCALGLAEGEVRKNLLKNIVRLNRERNYRIGTGFLSTPFVLGLLTEAGTPQDAYHMLTNPEFGWMQQIKKGATTVWENWTDDASLNHYSKGACCQWLFDCVCGIRLDERENHFIIEPHPVFQLENAGFVYESVYGIVESEWKKQGDDYVYHIVIPCNCMAEVKLPGEKARKLPAGSYEFVQPIKK